METRASHLVVGLFVLMLSIGAAIFGVWLAKRDVDQTFTVYEIVFPGSVFGLEEGSRVVYRGVPVGRVVDISIDRENPSQVLVDAEIEQSTPVSSDTTAVLIPQGVTGMVAIELRGEAGDALAPADGEEPPRITGQVSALEQVFTSTPELLSQAVAVMERIATALSDENIDRVSRTLANLENVTTTLAERREELGQLVETAADVGEEASVTLADLRDLLAMAEGLAGTIEQEIAGLGEQGAAALDEVGSAANAARNLAWRADRILEGAEEPLQDFSQASLYDFSEMIREIRTLVATLSRIATDFERDPTSFLIGGSRRGFTPE